MDERQRLYHARYTNAQRIYHRNMRDAFRRIQDCADNNWETLQELVPGENVEEYRTIFIGGYVTCEPSHIIGDLYDMIFRYRSIPIQFCKHPTQATTLNCNTMFAREGGLNQRNFETDINEQNLPRHMIRCMYLYLTENFIPELPSLGSQGPKHSHAEDVPPGGGGGGPHLNRPTGPTSSEWALVEQKINNLTSIL